MTPEFVNGTPQGANPLFSKEADELREMWQCRLLNAAKDREQAVAFHVLYIENPEVTEIVVRVIWPGFQHVQPPFLKGYAQITPGGRVVCVVRHKDGLDRVTKIYENKAEMVGKFRRLADGLKFTDRERTAMFALLGKWIVVDHGVDHLGNRKQ